MAKLRELETVLDGTQLSDFTDEYLKETCKLTSEQIAYIRGVPRQQLSTLIPLLKAVGKQRVPEVVESLPFIAEINERGHRRCVMKIDGVRCEKYGDKDVPVCKEHYKDAKMLGNHFGSPILRETYKRFYEDPNKMRCDSELTLMRTMLASLLQRITDDNLNIELIAGVTSMCDKITSVVERMGKIEKLTPEHINILMQQMTEVAAKYIPADKLEAFAVDIEKISVEPNKLTQRIPYQPGAEVEVNGKPVEITVQKRALVETAVRMGVQ
jgi:hypothetical protein